MQLIFTPSSKRARRARLAKLYADKWAYAGYKIIGLSGLALGALLAIYRSAQWLAGVSARGHRRHTVRLD